MCNTQIKLSCISNYEFGGNQLILNSSISTSSSVISVRKISPLAYLSFLFGNLLSYLTQLLSGNHVVFHIQLD